ncbi:pentatricopeptide repeat-containing protein At1g71490 [Malania oleifera]|uniref:pentatricopeptide repeat-containing protein At1g71490 n=1 Tax=Malania oleifera TaxID=397392 RepID=UPI0025AE0D75|nr:pentatricopeptide repeat-containing protein At1g71490 [Malania oleifera]
MPSSSWHVHGFPGGISLCQIQKFIPKRWKQSVLLDTHPESRRQHPSLFINSKEPIQGTLTASATTTPTDEFMIHCDFFTSLKQYASKGQLSKAFQTFALIQQFRASSEVPNHELEVHLCISSLLLSCTNLGSIPQGRQLHAHAISLGSEQHPVLVPKLVTFYSTLNLLVDARVMTENSNILHPLPWNILISAYVRNGLCSEALFAFKQMVTKGIRPDDFTYPSVLKACSVDFDVEFGRQVHQLIVKSGWLEWSLFVQNGLNSMYGRCGEVNIARDLFEKMPERDAVSWNTIIAAYASKDMWNSAFEVFESMRAEGKGLELDIITWNTIAGGCLRTGNFEGALKLISQMRTCGILDSVALLIGLGACSHIGAVKLGKEIHGFAIRNGCDEFETVKNALITMYSRCWDLEHAYVLFRLTECKSIITWNSMISGYAHMDRSEEASSLFREMLLSGVGPNYVTIASMLPLCARVANLQHGKEFHCHITRHGGFDDNLLLWNSLVDMYARSGKILEARIVFDLLGKKDEVTYTSLIAGYGMQGEGQSALKLFEEMGKLPIKPDHVTMVAVLSACSHSGLVSEGEMLFKKMPSIYGITPRLEHFACMVDLFGRAGLLNKAKDIIKRMPYRPTAAMWATLLGACRIHGNIEIGEWAAEKLFEARPKNLGYYVLIANMYAAAGCWSKLAKVRTFMRSFGVRKTPGCAWIDAGSESHSFLVGDTSNPDAHKIYPLLEGLTDLMKDNGYIAAGAFSSDECEELNEQGNL